VVAVVAVGEAVVEVMVAVAAAEIVVVVESILR
jgi:hypothetical protein